MSVEQTPFAGLLKDPRDLQAVADTIESAVAQSFGLVTGAATQVEVRRRTGICIEWFRILKGELGYSLRRACDFMAYCLVAQLLGVPFIPPRSTSGWVVPDPAMLVARAG